MKRTPLKRKSKTPEAKLKEELWELCKQIIRKKYGNVCYACGATGLSAGNWHTGHFIASSVCGANLRYDLRNLRPECYRCNISLSGNGAFFYKNMVAREGQEYVDQLFRDKHKVIKADSVWLQEKIDEYTIILEEQKTP